MSDDTARQKGNDTTADDLDELLGGDLAGADDADQMEAMSAAFSGNGVEAEVERRAPSDPSPGLGDDAEIDELGDQDDDAPAPEPGVPKKAKADGADDGDVDYAAENARLAKELRQLNGRFGNLTRDLEELKNAGKNAAATTKADGGTTPTQAQINAAMANPEKMAELTEEFPLFGEVLSAELQQLRSQMISPDTVREMLRATKQEVIEEMVSDVHEGWTETVNTPRFAAWFEAQEAPVKELADKPGARPAIKLLDQYKRYEAWVEGLGDEATQYRDSALLERYRQHALQSDRQSLDEPRKASRTAPDQRLLAATTPARGGGSVTRKGPISEEEAMREAFKRSR